MERKCSGETEFVEERGHYFGIVFYGRHLVSLGGGRSDRREAAPKGMKAFLFEGTSGLSIASAILTWWF